MHYNHKMATIMVAHALGCDVICHIRISKSPRLFQILMSYHGKIATLIAICSPINNSHNISIMDYKKAFCVPEKVLWYSTVLANKAAKLLIVSTQNAKPNPMGLVEV